MDTLHLCRLMRKRWHVMQRAASQADVPSDVINTSFKGVFSVTDGAKQLARWPLAVIDFEASSLEPSSFPIEVGVAVMARETDVPVVWSTLIKPDLGH